MVFHVETGEHIESSIAIPYVQLKGMNDFQSFGSGVTYYRRYALSCALLVTDKDTDASGEQDKKRRNYLPLTKSDLQQQYKPLQKANTLVRSSKHRFH
jgi:hypothetical protein